MKIISHSADNDGTLSAFLVGKKFNAKWPEDYILTDYGNHDDIFSRINKDEKVYVCDFSFENGPDDMKKLLDITKDITWIDHHESSIKAYGEFGKNIPGLRISGTAACMLVWFWFNLDQSILENLDQKECEKHYKDAPLVVQLVHDNDVWRHDDSRSAIFKIAMDMENTLPCDNSIWNYFISEDDDQIEININKYLDKGATAIKFRDSIGSRACNNYGFECTLNGKKGFALNNPFGGSPWFGDIIYNYDFVCCFNYNGKTKSWSYSFYSDSKTGANCFEIAKSINPKGGGHYHAAGCTSEEFIFN